MTRRARDLWDWLRAITGGQRPITTPKAAAFRLGNLILVVSQKQALDSSPIFWRIEAELHPEQIKDIGYAVENALSLYTYYPGLDYGTRGKAVRDNITEKAKEDGSTSGNIRFVGIVSQEGNVVFSPSHRSGKEHDFTGAKLTAAHGNREDIGRALLQSFEMST